MCIILVCLGIKYSVDAAATSWRTFLSSCICPVNMIICDDIKSKVCSSFPKPVLEINIIYSILVIVIKPVVWILVH